MKIICDEVPVICQDCIFCRGDGYNGLCCTLLNRPMPRLAVAKRRYSGCPLIPINEFFNYKFGKESAVNGEREGAAES